MGLKNLPNLLIETYRHVDRGGTIGLVLEDWAGRPLWWRGPLSRMWRDELKLPDQRKILS